MKKVILKLTYEEALKIIAEGDKDEQIKQLQEQVQKLKQELSIYKHTKW